MEASIHSKDDEKDGSRGKTHRVYSDKLAIRTFGTRLILTASDGEYYAPQDWMAVTPPRDIVRKLRLEFTAADLKQILDAALAANLLEPNFNVVAKPKKKK